MELTAKQVAQELGVSMSFVARLCRNGKLKARKLGRDWFIDPASVEAYKNAPKDKGGRPKKEKNKD